MPTNIPNLVGTRCDLLTVCSMIAQDNLVVGEWVSEVADIRCDSRDIRGADRQWVRLIISKFSDGTSHIHVNIAKESYFDGDPPTETMPLAQVVGHLANISGHAAFTVIRAHYAVSVDELPADGFACVLLGMAAKAGGEEMALTGFEMSVNGKPFDSFTCRREDDEISGMIEASRTTNLEDNYLNSALALIEQGIDKLILDRKAVQPRQQRD